MTFATALFALACSPACPLLVNERQPMMCDPFDQQPISHIPHRLPYLLVDPLAVICIKAAIHFHQTLTSYVQSRRRLIDSPCCSHCSSLLIPRFDSVEHRLFECPFFDRQRQFVSIFLTLLMGLTLNLSSSHALEILLPLIGHLLAYGLLH